MGSTPPLPLLSIRSLEHPQLRIDSLDVHQGQCWAIVGRNGAGKHLLGRLLTHRLEDFSGEFCLRTNRVRLLSFELQQALYEKELREDDSEFMEGCCNSRENCPPRWPSCALSPCLTAATACSAAARHARPCWPRPCWPNRSC
jgi:hypothetical protein